MRIPLSAKDRFRKGLFSKWDPDKRPEKWLARLPRYVVRDTSPRGKVVLDAGTGTKARFAIAFAKAGAERVVAMDISPPLIKMAREEAKREGVSDRIEFGIGDMEDLEYGDERFDIVCCMGTIIHLSYPSKGVSELKRVCKKGGLLVANTAMTEKPIRGNYWQTFTEDE
ncbi:unnamed protein product, partial [marine sediment metagenome]